MALTGEESIASQENIIFAKPDSFIENMTHFIIFSVE